jgi:hypothetical protein
MLLASGFWILGSLFQNQSTGPYWLRADDLAGRVR